MASARYIMLYSDRLGRGQQTGNNLGRLFLLAKERKARLWAIYHASVKGKQFHNATDKSYLVVHDDPYWRNRGV